MKTFEPTGIDVPKVELSDGGKEVAIVLVELETTTGAWTHEDGIKRR